MADDELKSVENTGGKRNQSLTRFRIRQHVQHPLNTAQCFNPIQTTPNFHGLRRVVAQQTALDQRLLFYI